MNSAIIEGPMDQKVFKDICFDKAVTGTYLAFSTDGKLITNKDGKTFCNVTLLDNRELATGEEQVASELLEPFDLFLIQCGGSSAAFDIATVAIHPQGAQQVWEVLNQAFSGDLVEITIERKFSDNGTDIGEQTSTLTLEAKYFNLFWIRQPATFKGSWMVHALDEMNAAPGTIKSYLDFAANVPGNPNGPKH